MCSCILREKGGGGARARYRHLFFQLMFLLEELLLLLLARSNNARSLIVLFLLAHYVALFPIPLLPLLFFQLSPHPGILLHLVLTLRLLLLPLSILLL